MAALADAAAIGRAHGAQQALTRIQTATGPTGFTADAAAAIDRLDFTAMTALIAAAQTAESPMKRARDVG